MEKDTFYCSFVGNQFIICDCGQSFETEELLKTHLEQGHKKKPHPIPRLQLAGIGTPVASKAITGNKTPQAPIYIIKNDTENVLLKYPNTSISNILRKNTGLPRASSSKVKIEKTVPTIPVKQEIFYEDYEELRPSSSKVKRKEKPVPVTTIPVKQEIVYEEINENVEEESVINDNEDYSGHKLYRLQDGTTILVQDDMTMEIPEVIQEHNEQEVEGKVIGEVTFREEMIKDEIIILDSELGEHDYDAEPTPLIEQVFFCDVCGKSFNSRPLAMAHIARMHTRNEEERTRFQQFKQIICDFCGETYAECYCGSKKKEPRKVRKNKLEKKFVCDVCDKGFYSNASLRYHQRIHTGEKPYQCHYCPKAFTMPLFLQIHHRVHTGERPYNCQRCPKAFTNKAALLRHDRVHTGEKPYSCPHCMKPFSQSNSMKLHVHTVHLKLPTPYKSKARQMRASKPQKIRKTQQEEDYVVEEMTYEDDSDSNYYDTYTIAPDI